MRLVGTLAPGAIGASLDVLAYVAAALLVFAVIAYAFLRLVQGHFRNSTQGLSILWDSREIESRDARGAAWMIWGTVAIFVAVAAAAWALHPILFR